MRGLRRTHVIVWTAVDVGKVSIARLQRHCYIMTALNGTNASHICKMFRDPDIIIIRRGSGRHQPISLHDLFQRPLGWVRRHEHLEKERKSQLNMLQNTTLSSTAITLNQGRTSINKTYTDLMKVTVI